MRDYKKVILNKLLDKYENSQGYKGEVAKARKVYFQFNEKNIIDYYDELDASKKRDIDISCKQLEEKQIIKIHWGKGFNNHNIIKLELNENIIEEVYKILNRKEKKSKEEKLKEILESYRTKENCLGYFSRFIFDMLENNKSIKKYLDLDNLKECKDIIIGIEKVLNQKEEIFRRSFSIKLYGDSKRYEALENKILRIIGDFSKEWNIEEYNILKNYTYVYFKGDIQLKMKRSTINALDFKGGFAISSKDIDEIETIKVNSSELITIENLTSFNNYNENNSVIYLGGYHNSVRQKLLTKIYEINKHVTYYHCGDIDVGGFKILNHLKRKTSIPFLPLNMDIETLEKNISYGKELTANDRKELEKMINDEIYSEYKEILSFILNKNRKLEQEIIF